jgi:UDP-glucose 4-epimerase
MRVLVTGGAGFIGSHCVEALKARGDTVVVLDDLSSGFWMNLQDCPPDVFFLGSITDEDQVARVFYDTNPDGVIHLAAQVSVQASIENPVHDHIVNVHGTRNVARHATLHEIPMVMASSAAVYGDTDVIPNPVGSPTNPVNPYGCSKLESEGLVSHGVLRFSNVYGPRQSTQGEGGVVAHFCERVAHGLRPVVNGEGTQTRDFIHVSDIVDALLLNLDDPSPTPKNVSTGIETSVIDLALMLDPHPQHAPALEGEIVRSVLVPDFRGSTPVRDGVRDTLASWDHR